MQHTGSNKNALLEMEGWYEGGSERKIYGNISLLEARGLVNSVKQAPVSILRITLTRNKY